MLYPYYNLKCTTLQPRLTPSWRLWRLAVSNMYNWSIQSYMQCQSIQSRPIQKCCLMNKMEVLHKKEHCVLVELYTCLVYVSKVRYIKMDEHFSRPKTCARTESKLLSIHSSFEHTVVDKTMPTVRWLIQKVFVPSQSQWSKHKRLVSCSCMQLVANGNNKGHWGC